MFTGGDVLDGCSVEFILGFPRLRAWRAGVVLPRALEAGELRTIGVGGYVFTSGYSLVLGREGVRCGSRNTSFGCLVIGRHSGHFNLSIAAIKFRTVETKDICPPHGRPSTCCFATRGKHILRRCRLMCVAGKQKAFTDSAAPSISVSGKRVLFLFPKR